MQTLHDDLYMALAGNLKATFNSINLMCFLTLMLRDFSIRGDLEASYWKGSYYKTHQPTQKDLALHIGITIETSRSGDFLSITQ